MKIISQDIFQNFQQILDMCNDYKITYISNSRVEMQLLAFSERIWPNCALSTYMRSLLKVFALSHILCVTWLVKSFDFLVEFNSLTSQSDFMVKHIR